MEDPELSQLHGCWEILGPRARRVLLSIADRLAIGAVRYGDDLSPGRDWKREGLEEALDCAVYLARHLQDGAK